jgi:site-specific DNA-methyltransferase (cytosine-N4-specific)
MPLPRPYYTTSHGATYLGDTIDLIKHLEDESVDLILTSPPFGLQRKKAYGNVAAEKYVRWFLPFAREFHRVLKRHGSFVLDIGGSWNPGFPTKSLYNFELVVSLCKEIGFHLAQDFYWFNPAKLPTPAEWVTVRRIRVKDAVNTIWWLSKAPFPRPILPTLTAIDPLGRYAAYLEKCRKAGLCPHPTRHPEQLPDLVVMLFTDEDRLFPGYSCACEEPGVFNSGILGILSGTPLQDGSRYIERCDICERFASDEAAAMEYSRVKSGRNTYDIERKVVWVPE